MHNLRMWSPTDGAGKLQAPTLPGKKTKLFLKLRWVSLRAEPKDKFSGSSGNRTVNPRSSSTYDSPYNDQDSFYPNHGSHRLNIDLFYINSLFDHKRNALTIEEHKITSTVENLQQYWRNMLQHINRVERSCSWLPRRMFQYVPEGSRSRGRPWKRWRETVPGHEAYYWKGWWW